MRHLLNLAILCLVILVTLAALSQAGSGATLVQLAQPEAAIQLEAQRQAHAEEMAEISARLESQRMEQSTMRLALLLLFVLLVVVATIIVWGALAASARRNTYVLLPGSPGFHAALSEQGGYWQDDLPMIDGRIVDRLEVMDE